MKNYLKVFKKLRRFYLKIRSDLMSMSKKKREKYIRMMMVGMCIVMVVMFIVPIIVGS